MLNHRHPPAWLIKFVIQIKLVFGQTMNQISSTALRLHSLHQQQHKYKEKQSKNEWGYLWSFLDFSENIFYQKNTRGKWIFRWVSPRLFRVSFPVTSRSRRSRSGGGGDKIIVMWSAERSVPSQWEKTREQRTSWQQLTSFQWFTDWQFVWRVSCDSEIRPRWVDGEQSSVKSCHQSQSDRHHHITTARAG